MRAAVLIFGLCLLSACQLALPGKGDKAGTANPITGGAVAVTSLDAPPAAAAANAAAQPAKPVAAAPTTAPAPVAASPAKPPPPAAAPAVPAAPQPVMQSEPEMPAAALSPQELACRAEGGTWGLVRGTIAHTCVKPTPDAGKACTKQGDCSTQCLARSRTCAPITPLIGCNPVLQSDGSEVVLCID